MIINKSIGLTLDIVRRSLTRRSFLAQQFPEKLLLILWISCLKMSNLGVFKCHTLILYVFQVRFRLQNVVQRLQGGNLSIRNATYLPFTTFHKTARNNYNTMYTILHLYCPLQIAQRALSNSGGTLTEQQKSDLFPIEIKCRI